MGPEDGLTGSPPRVSVVVPVKDRRDLLHDLLEGLTKQTFPNFEVVVVDDGSSDGSGEEVTRRAALDPRFRQVRTPGVGAVGARCAGVEAARGEILAFTDSDCVPDADWLTAGVAAIDAGADLVQGATLPERPAGPLERTISVRRDDGLYATCNVFYRRNAFERAGGFDPEAGSRLGFRPGHRARGLGFGEDTLLGWRVRGGGRATFSPEAVVHHHVFPPQLRDSLRRAWMAGGFPALVREAPGLRDTLLTQQVFLGTSRIPLYAAGAAAVLRQPRLSAGCLTWWAAGHARRARRRGTPVRALPATVAALLARDLTLGLALLTGTARTRTPVL